jgi:L-lactate dehydrogenase complex protein LldF
MNPLDTFLSAANKKAFSAKHRSTIKFNIGKYDQKVLQGKQQFADLELARRKAKRSKWAAVEQLDVLLLEFEQKFTERGGKVIWAETPEQAQAEIQQILQKHQTQLVVKSKSMITEEIELNPFLEKLGIETLETDLGEYIVQLRNEPPYHIITPAMHLSKGDIAELFTERFQLPPHSSPETITAYVREKLRQKFATATVGITGANFLIADVGGILITENEGNARLATTLPPVHIAIVGIEKILASVRDLGLFLPLLATYGTGQNLTVYNSILTGAKQADETDGAQEMYVILLDNGRTRLLADPKLRQSLYCIRCGSCLNNCPVYRNIGGHTYETPYSGPIGSVISPHLGEKGEAGDFNHLSNASTLCGACSASCPLRIELHDMLLYNRHLEENKHQKTRSETRVWGWWAWAMQYRWLMNVPNTPKKLFSGWFLKSLWGERREFPEFEGASFNQWWKKHQNSKNS